MLYYRGYNAYFQHFTPLSLLFFLQVISQSVPYDFLKKTRLFLSFICTFVFNYYTFFCLMKNIITVFILAILAFSFVKADDNKYAQASFAEKTFDFGIIKEADGPVSTTFVVTNTGNKPLLILDVTVSCGCTSRQFTTRPIAPGQKGEIHVTYDPAGRPGAFRKDLKVRTNGRERRTTLFIEGTTIPSRN